ncbi:hypothetical protein QJ527_03285 [Enterococcus mundtii]|uniref:hypothetical protein n=1 Tax=Enterococcus TaxID=1350 RepID=UPI001F49E51F|nr:MULTISPECIES: hypothetical protein [Enterococcus]MDK4210569.1 hypothetical protein [Enterococcus mundtii]MDO7879003.1 hypothetical protein [Enterococcus mundtii]MEC3940460.1 hypothetical protein [Enterococcus mundtii]
MTELSNLPNVGKVLEENLRKIVMTTEDNLKKRKRNRYFLKFVKRWTVAPVCICYMESKEREKASL